MSSGSRQGELDGGSRPWSRSAGATALRADTVREIKETARQVLVEQGVDGLALRAVAREMGMTAPALYRYFDSREDLVEHVVADLYDELVDVLEAARDAARPADAAPIQLLACSRAFRRWATTHHAEFGLLFGSAGEGVVPAHGTRRSRGQSGRGRRPAVRRASSPSSSRRSTPSAASRCRPTTRSSRALQEQLRSWCAKFPVQLPLGRHAGVPVLLDPALRPGLHGGLRAPEVRPRPTPEPMFEAELHSLAEVLGGRRVRRRRAACESRAWP